ncbi:MAG TPA: FAD-dependent oxidoreductase [Thermoanaerobaculia bacterium]|nr:FAD-dependent oxidoreductase [Thermoanaerobaculia bacterium]
MSGGIVILGAGPTGLGAAYRLRERGEDAFEIYERSGQVGGLATSFTDPKGWTWDVSGHIIFSGYKYFNDFLAKVLGTDGIRWIDRESWIKFEDKYVRYPFQNHLSSLPERAMLECLIGLVESQTIDKDRAFKNFEEWVLAKFGAGVAKHFMNPYNFKVWATPLKEMGYYWIAERVSVVEWRKAIEATVSSKTTDWGPNAKFGYPLHGGTLGLWKGALPFVGDRVRYHKRAISVDEEKREIAFSDGTTRSYDRLLTTLPLEAFVSRLQHAPEKVRAATQKLLYNHLFSVGVGLRRPSPSDKNWIYFPNPKTPFYRMTYLSNYSPEIVPGGDTSKYFSVLTETSYSKFKPLPEGDFGKAVVDGLVAEGILQPSDLPLIETVFLIHAGHSYPIPSLERNGALETIHAYLEPRGIFSRGRFGSWKYEIGNQDHSLMQGVQLVDRWMDGTEEKVFRS